MSSKPNRIAVISKSKLDAESTAHLKRVSAIFTRINEYYGASSQIYWINIVHGQFKDRSKANKAMPELGVTDLIYSYKFPLPGAGILLSWLVSLKTLFALFIKFGKGKNLIFWAEMTESVWPILLYQKFFKVPLIVDVHGTVDEVVQFGKQSWLTSLDYARRIFQETNILWQANALVFVSNAMQQHYNQRWINLTKNQHIIPISISQAATQSPQETRSEMRNQLNIQNKFVFVYAGSTAPWQEADLMLTLFEQITHAWEQIEIEPFLLFLTNDKEFIDRQSHLSASRYCFMSVTPNEVHKYLTAADIGLLLRNNATTNIVSSPTKAGEYLFAGLPILCTQNIGDLSENILEKSLGYVFDYNHLPDPIKLYKFCLSVQENRDSFAANSIALGNQLYSTDNYNIIKEIISPFLKDF